MKKLNLLIILSLLFSLLTNCSIEEPVLPRWVVPFVIPISTEKIIIQEEIVNDTSIVSSGDSLFINIDGEIEPQSITAEDLTISGQTMSDTFALDTLRFDTLNALSTGEIQISELFPMLSNQVGDTAYIPKGTISTDPRVINATEFKKVKVQDGFIQLKVHNNLPLTIGPNSSSPDGLEVIIRNDSTGTLISDIVIPEPIKPGQTGTGTAPIGGSGSIWIYSSISLEYRFPVAEDTSFLVTQELLDSSSYKMDIKLFDLAVSEVHGKVDAQHVERNLRINWTEKDKIIKAELEEGTINLTVKNSLPLTATIDASFPDILDASGNPYQTQLNMEADGTTHHSFQLDGFTIQNSEMPGSVLDDILVNVDVFTEETTEFVPIKSTDKIAVTMDATQLSLKSLEGFLYGDTLNIDPIEENDLIDYEGFNTGINFQGARLLLTFQNQIDIENLQLKIDLTGYHREDGVTTNSATISIDEYMFESGPQDTLILQGMNVDQFLNILPTDVKVSGTVMYSGMANVQQGDQIWGDYVFTTPFKLKIENPDPVNIDVDTLFADDIEEDVQDAAGDEIQSAKLFANVLNHSPLGGEAKLFVSADPAHQDIYDTTAYFNPELEFVKSLQINKASVDPATGFVNNAEESQINFYLNKQELQVFSHPPVRIGVSLNLEETNGYVVLQGSDFIEFSGKFEIKVLVKDDDE